jgi:polysaccharide biosynthesis/export protein
MTKRNKSLHGTGWRARWGMALAMAMLAAYPVNAARQSELRFVESGESLNSVTVAQPLPSPAALSAAPIVAPNGSEFRLLELKEGKIPSRPQFTVSGPRSTTGEMSTLTFTAPKPDAVGGVSQNQSPNFELRFVPTQEISAAEPESVATEFEPVAPKSPVMLESRNLVTATELFAIPPHTRPNAFKPRIVAVLEHVPAPAPQPEEAQHLRAARELAPTFAPAGTELFVNLSPQVAPKEWNIPALDYGSALKKIEPPQPLAAAPKPIEPTRVVARELPTLATEMFSFAPAQPIIVQPPVAKTPVVQLPVVPKAPIVAEQKVTAPTIAAAPIVAAPPVAVLPPPVAPVVTAPVASAPVAATPRPMPAAVPEKMVAAPAPKLPAAAELDFSTLPIAVEQPKSHFTPAPATIAASATPIAIPAATSERLVPAAASQHVVAPNRNQVAVTTEPSDPNVYTFRYVPTTNEMPATLVNNLQPATTGVSPEPAAVAPEMLTAPCDCNNGCNGPYGCPYLPGQSGTRALCGVDCGSNGAPCCSTWSDAQCIPWSLFGPGEYIGPARPAHVETYYLRVNDNITLTFIASRKKSAEHYRIGIGDELQIEWLQGAGNTETPLDRKLLVQPDGTVTLPLIGEVMAAGKTVSDFRDEAVKLYGRFQRDPQITVTPLTVNVAVQDVLKAVTSKDASSGQTQDLRVTPEGTIQAAGIGSVFVQGLTLDELRSELEARYAEAYGPGLAVSPQLTERATSYVFIGGEVRSPGRYTLEGPTTVMQAIALAGSWNNGGNVKQVVVFRRDENWCLKATKIDVRAPLYGKDPCPTNDVWLRENDLVLVPKTRILCATDLIELYFTRGVYAVFPINYVYDFSASSGIVPIP